MKKIILIGFSFFFFMMSPLAKTLKINDVSYEIKQGEILKTNDFIFHDTNNVLELSDSSLDSIEIDGNLKIILQGNNKITNKNKRAGIICKNLEIVGGNLEINSTSRGIYSQGDNVIITNTNLTLITDNVGIVVGITIGNLAINNSNIILNSKVDAFRVIDGNIFLNSTNLISTSTYIAGGLTRNFHINSSNIKAKLTNNKSITMVLKYISGDSSIFIEDIQENLDLRKFILNDNFKLMGSSDNNDYQEIINNKNYKYLKIESLNNFNNKEELLKKEQELKILEEKLKKVEEEKKLKDQELLKKEQELKEKQEYINNLNKKLETKENELLNSLKNEKELKEELNLKQQELKNKNQLINNLEQLIEKEEHDKIICNLENTKKTSNDIIENPKTLDNFGKLIIYLITSLIGFGIVIYLSRRRKHEYL